MIMTIEGEGRTYASNRSILKRVVAKVRDKLSSFYFDFESVEFDIYEG